MRSRLAHQVLAAAKTDLEPHRIDRLGKERAKLGHGCGQIERESRQQRLQQRGLPRPQAVALAASKKGARLSCVVVDRHDTRHLDGMPAQRTWHQTPKKPMACSGPGPARQRRPATTAEQTRISPPRF